MYNGNFVLRDPYETNFRLYEKSQVEELSAPTRAAKNWNPPWNNYRQYETSQVDKRSAPTRATKHGNPPWNNYRQYKASQVDERSAPTRVTRNGISPWINYRQYETSQVDERSVPTKVTRNGISPWINNRQYETSQVDERSTPTRVTRNGNPPVSQSSSKRKTCCIKMVRGFNRKREEFANDTTMHGIKFICGANQSVFARIFWLILFLLGISGCLYTVIPLIESYEQGQTSTSTSNVATQDLVFPAITICNTNTLRRSVVSGSKAFLNNALAQVAYPHGMGDLICRNDTPLSPILSTYLDNPENITKLGIYAFASTMMDSFHNVMNCTFDALSVPCDDQFVNKMTDFGLCFVFNPRKEYRVDKLSDYTPAKFIYPGITGDVIRTFKTGPITGLRLILNAQQFDYCDAGGPSINGAGFRMMVHDPEIDAMFTMQDSIGLAPGTDTSVAVSYNTFSNQTQMTKICVNSIPEIPLTDNGNYFIGSCYMECLLNETYKWCDCYPYFAPPSFMQKQFTAKQKPMAELICIKNEQTQCFQDTVVQFYNKILTNMCPMCKIPCESSSYTTETTSQLFPADNVAPLYMNLKYPTFSQRWMNTLAQYPYANMTAIYEAANQGSGPFADVQELRNNLLSVRVYLKSLSYASTVQQDAINAFSLASQIGGALGLFLGASLLSGFELLFYPLIGLINYGVKKRCQSCC